MTEPWISGSLTGVDALLRPVLHSLEHARLDLAAWTEGLTPHQLWARPLGLGAVGFHIRHIARSTGRLFTYVQGRPLSEAQMAELMTEMEPAGRFCPEASREELLAELDTVFHHVAEAVRAIDVGTLREPRAVGRKQLPTTVAGLLVHLAEHNMRHVGQAIITVKVVKAL